MLIGIITRPCLLVDALGHPFIAMPRERAFPAFAENLVTPSLRLGVFAPDRLPAQARQLVNYLRV